MKSSKGINKELEDNTMNQRKHEERGKKQK